MRTMLKCLTLMMAACLSARAAAHNFGLGFEVGDPTGFSGKLWTSSTTAFDFNVGWSGSLSNRDGYYDPDCDRNSFYNNHQGYCNDQAYNYRGDYGYGWRIFHMHADYLFHNFDAIRSTERFPLFYGPGISMNYLNYNFLQVGVRGDFGIAWMPRHAPMDIFLELAPTMDLFPGPQFEVSAGLGARYYF